MERPTGVSGCQVNSSGPLTATERRAAAQFMVFELVALGASRGLRSDPLKLLELLGETAGPSGERSAAKTNQLLESFVSAQGRW